MDQWTMIIRAPSPIVTGTRTIYWNLQWDDLPERVSYFASLGGEELLSLWWDYHSNAGGTHGDARYGDWTHTTERRENVGVLVWHIPPPIHLLMPESTTSTGQHVWFTQPDQIPKAMATLTPKDQAEYHTHRRRRPPNSSPHEIYIFPTLDFYCSCGIQLHGIPVPSSKLNVGGGAGLCQMNLLIFPLC